MKEPGKPKRKIGQEFEALASNYLQSQGYEILERNYHGRYGEIDLVARENNSLVFVEVRMRRRGGWVSALESLTARKRQALWVAGERYLAEHEIHDTDVRFDLVAISVEDGMPSIELFQNILEEEG
jgi:putative endonuclease